MVKRKTRRMPPHIVLPNGMWRFVKRGSKAARRKLTPRRSRVKRKVKHMARRRGIRRRARRAYSGYRRMGGGTLMRGLFPVPKLISSALLGAGAAYLQARFAPQVIPYQGAAVGFALGGVPGAAGAFLLGLVGNGGGQAAGGNY